MSGPASTIDVLALYNDGFRAAQGGYPYTRIHHVMVLANAMYVDSGTNLRLRTVGMSEVALGESGRPSSEDYDELQERHGADLSIRFHTGSNWGCPDGSNGCAGVGGVGQLGHWRGETTPAAVLGFAHVTAAAHELGHVLGLLHSARQGEATGAFRWSRGHYMTAERGTIMSYGVRVLGGVFSDPDADCVDGPCGAPVDEPDGAHAVRSLDLVRFQVAGQRASQPDTDGDGIVDVADALPEDPAEFVDIDGDGIGDRADTDDDNDGVADADDAFPLDPTEWEDADDDGVGDNADAEVLDLSPFRDAALRAAVETALGKEAGAPITAGDLSELTTLLARDQGIRDLTGLELARSLEQLSLITNDVSELTPLARLPNLWDLDLWGNAVTDLTPLQGMPALTVLHLTQNPVSDLSPLADLPRLERLYLGGPRSAISDIAPLAELPGLTALNLWRVQAPDLSPLEALTKLRSLRLDGVGLADLSLLSAMTELQWLNVADNPVADLSPLSRFTRLWDLNITRTRVRDLSPLSSLALRTLKVGWSDVTLEDVLALPHARQLSDLRLGGLGIEDLSPLADFERLRILIAPENAISDLSPLSALSGLYWLDLRNNHVSDIGPVVHRSFWDLESAPSILLYGNPLDDAALDDHIPTLQSWGISVDFDAPDQGGAPPVHIADPSLRALIAQAIAGALVTVDDPINAESIKRLRRLRAFNAGVSELAGVEAAVDLWSVLLGSNSVSDLTPLASLDALTGLDLSDNLISDLSPLVENPGIGGGDWISLTGNPLSEESLNVHIPALLERGVHIGLDSIRLQIAPDGSSAAFDTSGYFDAVLGPDAGLDVATGEGSPATAELVDGVLSVTLLPARGHGTVTVTGTGLDGATEALVFQVSFRQVVPLLPSAATALYQGFVRVINHASRAGTVVIRATDDAGRGYDPLTLSLRGNQTVHFNSDDLQLGNPAKGLSQGLGPGTGDWHLHLASTLDIEVLAYVRTADGFVTAMHDLARRAESSRGIPIFNPGSNRAQVSMLRMVNQGQETAEIVIRGVDDLGQSPGDDIRLSIGAGAARTLTAAELEAGQDVTGALGDGSGKWRLTVESSQPVYAMSLLGSPTGHLTNLSNGPVAPSGAAHGVPLFPAAMDADGRQGFVRVINRENASGTVTVTAVDDSGQEYGPAVLSIGPHHAVHFNSDDLEAGNPSKGLSGGTGAGDGAWRLVLTSDLDVDVLGYVRTTVGFLTSMHAVAPTADTRHRIAIFNPGGNRSQVSVLRLINPGAEPARVTVTGFDDSGASPGAPVRLTVPPHAVRAYTAEQLEIGSGDLRGALGDGTGKWRLIVESDRPITAMSLLESPTGHLSNLSTAPMR